MATGANDTTTIVMPNNTFADSFTPTALIPERELYMTNYSSTTPVSEVAARSAVLIIITLLSLFGNSIVCITLYRRQYLLTPSNKLVLSLTSTNFAFSVIVMPFVVTSSITEHWYLGKVWCSITGFLTLLVKGASMLILAGIACDRYYAIIHPMSYPSVITGFRATVVIIICWVVAAICAAPPLFGGWSRYEFQPRRSGCFPVWQNELGFTLFWITVCFFAPYCAMIGCYACIFKVARTKIRQVNFKVDCTPRHSSEDDGSNSQDSDSYADSFPTTRVIEGSSKENLSKDDERGYGATEGDSGINVSGSTHPSTSGSDYTFDHKQRSKEHPQRIYSDCSRLHLPNQVECKDSPKFTGRRRSNAGGSVDDVISDFEPPMKNSRKSSNASIISSTSQVFRRTSLAFSAVKYYSNQMKAVFTIVFILGILLCTMGPFVIVALIEASQTPPVDEIEATNGDTQNSPVPTVTMSVSTCFLYLTCVYYPLIYGLWNRTVRKEMRNQLCGHKHREIIPHRVRILSLATHIQDLGMSPGIAAAIIGASDGSNNANGSSLHDQHRQRRRSAYNLAMRDQEPVPVVGNKRRHTLHSLPTVSLPPTSNGGSHINFPFHGRHGGLHSWVSRDTFHGRHGIGVIEEESEKEESAASKPLEAPNSVGNVRRWRNGYSIPTVSNVIEENEETNGIGIRRNFSTKRTRQVTDEDIRIPLTRGHSMKSQLRARERPVISSLLESHSRAREKPATSSLLQLSSAEVLSNAALSSALLFAGCGFENKAASVNSSLSNSESDLSKTVEILPLNQPPEIVVTPVSVEESHHAAPDSSNMDEVPPSNIGISESATSENGASDSNSHNKCNNEPADGRDAISLLTEGRLKCSNLIHLEAGEPKNVRKWSDMEFVDFFASSVAYGVVEAGKTQVQEDMDDETE